MRRVTGPSLLWLAACTTALTITGCGGGGGGGSNGSPQVQIQSRAEALDKVVVTESTDNYMSFFSDAYKETDGSTKADLRLTVQNAFTQYDFVRWDVISRRIDEVAANSLYDEATQIRAIIRNRSTGEQVTEDANFAREWAKEGSTWRIVTENTDSIVQVLSVRSRSK